MTRPKISDMDPLELARWRTLQTRRLAHRALAKIACIEDPTILSPEEQDMLDRNARWFQTALVLTRPAWVASASLDELRQVRQHILESTPRWSCY